MTEQPQLLVYKASAGSGKTFTLAVQYICQLIEDPRAYRNILAVTFTNKATAEMKERILEQLLGIARNLKESDGYMKKIQEITGKTEKAIRDAAREALFFILHDYSRFRIETIDSFFQSVMRNLARELELGANLTIELNNGEVLADAVETMLEKLSRKDAVLYWLMEYIEERISDDKRWDVSEELKFFGRNIFDEGYMERGQYLRKKLTDPTFIPALRKQLTELREEVLQQMKGFSEQFFGTLELNGLSPDDLKNKERGISSYFKKIGNGELSGKVRLKTVEDCLENAENWTTKSAKQHNRIIEIVNEELLDLLKNAEEFRMRNNPILNSCELVLKHLNNLRLLDHINQEVRLQNELHNRFLLSDTNVLLHGLIHEGDASFVYEKIGTQINTVMIDEFQDTSRMQWENFHLLLEESLAQKEGSLIVGDIKQSIYRWRNGDWKILAGLNNDRSLRIKECTLDTNWRSETRIILFNNAFFPLACRLLSNRQEEELNEPCTPLLNAYKDVKQLSAKKDCKGFVKVSFLTDTPDMSYTEATFQELAAEINRLTAKGVAVNDIAILVRKNKNIPAIATYFDKHTGYRIVSDEAFRLDASLAVCIMIDALRFLTDPENNIAQARLAVAFQREVLKQNIDLNTILLNNPADYLPAEFILQTNELKLMPLYELLEKLFEVFCMKNIEDQDAYLCAFFDAVTEYMQMHSSELTAFLSYWDEQLHEKTIPSGEIEGIRILSIHKSKGLEYHTVLIPFCDWKMENETNAHLIWCMPDKQNGNIEPFDQLDLAPINYSSVMAESVFRESYLEERLQLWVDNMNLLYVAFTRACQNLIIWSCQEKKNTVAELIKSTLTELKNSSQPEIRLNGLQELEADYEATDIAPTRHDEVSQIEKRKETKKIVTYEYGELCASEKVHRKVSENPLSVHGEGVKIKIESLKTDFEFKQSNRSADFIRGEDEEENSENRSYYIRQGQLLHQVFASIEKENDLTGALTRLRMEGVISSEKQEQQISKIAQRALNNPKVKDWYGGSWTLYNECSIIYTDEEGNIQTRRPDRVMMRGTEVVIVDFKFGQRKESHQAQVKEYMQLLSKMGYPQAKGYLWYVFANELEEVLCTVN